MSDPSPVIAFVHQAEKRLLWNRSLARGAESASVGLCGILLLLLVGAQLLDWTWLVAIVAASLALGGWRVFSNRPSRYRISQIADRNLSLPDTVSTAWHFCEKPVSGEPLESVVAIQRRQAEDAVRLASPETAMPLRTPFAAYVAGALFLAATGLFATRYLIMGSLDLRPPIARGLDALWRTPLGETPKPRTEIAKAKLPEWMQNTPIQAIVPEEDLSQTLPPGKMAPISTDSPLTQGQRPLSDQPTPLDSPDTQEISEGSENADSSGKDGANADQSPSPQGGQNKNGDNKNQNAPSQEESDLIKKLQDAMANLLAKLNLNDLPTTGKQRDSGANRPGEGKGGEEKGDRKQGKPGPGDAEGEGEGQPDQQGQQMAQGGDAKQSRPGESGDSSSNATAQNKSGVGKQEGSKEIRDAQQQEAMGKISEILGKRAENLTGEVTIEVSSGKQQLRTPYVSRSANHTAAGAEVRRNEIPIEYQHYVQQYFEQLRRAEAQSGANGVTASKPAPAQAP